MATEEFYKLNTKFDFAVSVSGSCGVGLYFVETVCHSGGVQGVILFAAWSI